jgi:hypothetical protein
MADSTRLSAFSFLGKPGGGPPLHSRSGEGTHKPRRLYPGPTDVDPPPCGFKECLRFLLSLEVNTKP